MAEEKKGFFKRLVSGLTKTRDNIVAGFDSLFTGYSTIDDDFYEEWKYSTPQNPRNIYKISQYQDGNSGDVYVVYLSGKNPIEGIFRYGQCVFVSNINDELKIVKSYSFGYDDRKIKKRFETGIGLPDISFETLQKPIFIERYMPPSKDKDGMEHYEMDI